MVIYLTIFVLNVLDLALSHLAVNVLQIGPELNPLMAPILGSWLIVPVKLGAAGFFVYLLYRANKKHPNWWVTKVCTWIALIFYTLVVASNTLILILG